MIWSSCGVDLDIFEEKLFYSCCLVEVHEGCLLVLHFKDHGTKLQLVKLTLLRILKTMKQKIVNFTPGLALSIFSLSLLHIHKKFVQGSFYVNNLDLLKEHGRLTSLAGLYFGVWHTVYLWFNRFWFIYIVLQLPYV